MRVLAEADWTQAQRRHEERVDVLLAAHLDRGRRGRKHPVEDFLFTYYSFRPARLRRWHPGHDAVLAGAGARTRLTWPFYAESADGAGVGVDLSAFRRRRADMTRLAADLLEATAARPANLRCFGLHEWAMVYRLPADRVRHVGLPLRLGPADTDAVVDHHPIRCTHFDAYRFFTPDARPLNAVRPTADAGGSGATGVPARDDGLVQDRL